MQLAAQQVARVGAVVLDLFAVGAVARLLAVQLLQPDDRDHRQRDALVRGPEHHVEIEPEVIVDGARVVQAQAVQLLARHIGARVHEEGDFLPLFSVNSPNLSTSLSTMNSMNSCLYCSIGSLLRVFQARRARCEP